MSNPITIEEWPLPELPTFDNCIVEVDFVVDDQLIKKVKTVNCVFRKRGYPEQSRQLNGIPTLLEKQVIELLEADLDNILSYIEENG
jgi:hypothetical protein